MISIVMPTHKKPPLLYATLISVFSQKFDDFEFIVVDASDDGYFEEACKNEFETNVVLSKKKDRMNKMRIVRASENRQFPGIMKHLGFSNCVQDDDFVIFLDHDDFLGENILEHIRKAAMQYPNTEMISTRYTSIVYRDGCFMTNLKTFAGGIPCDKTEYVSIGGMWFRFKNKQDIYDNEHSFKSNLHPKIISKKAMRDHRFRFVDDTERIDDPMWCVISHSFVETHIPLVGYVYVGYSKCDIVSNSCNKERKVSDKSKRYNDICSKYAEMLEEVGYKKPRNEYVL